MIAEPKKISKVSSEPTENEKAPVKVVPSANTTQQTPTNVRMMSDQDIEVSQLVKEAPANFGQMDVRTLGQINLLELPEECYPLHDKVYRFRWIAKNKNTSARLRSSIWALCTRTNAPFIKPHRFKDHGAVEQAGMLLAFAPQALAKQREEAPAKRSADLVKHYTEDLPQDEVRGFYKPESSGKDDDESNDGLIEGRDF